MLTAVKEGLPLKKPKNATYMRQNNRKFIIQMIHKKQVSRADLARKTGLTRAAISVIVDDLIRKGIVREAGLGESTSGRKPVVLELNNEQLYCIGIGIRYDCCHIGISSINGNIIAEKRLDLTNLETAEQGIDQISAVLQSMLDTYVSEEIVVLGIGVSSPGPVDINSGIILNPPPLEIWWNVPIVTKLNERFNIPVFLDRDTAASALVEKNYGKGKKYKNFIQIDVIKEGVGCGIIINDQLYRGVSGFGGEFGHISINVQGIQCRCGNIGCIECYASISAILNTLRGIFPEIQSWKDLVLRSKDDETLANVIKEEAHYLGAGILSVMNLLELEAVILSGEVVFEPYMLLDELRQYINSRSITRTIKSIDVLISNTDYTLSFTSSATIVSEKFFSGELMEF